MVLDDLLPLVESPAFAELVHGALASPEGDAISVDEIEEALSGSRYSRILSVTVAGSSPERVSVISAAVKDALPTAVSTYLVAPGETQPTTRIIDPGAVPEQQTLRRWLSIGVISLFSLFGAVSLVWLREAIRVAHGTRAIPHAETGDSFVVKKASR